MRPTWRSLPPPERRRIVLDEDINWRLMYELRGRGRADATAVKPVGRNAATLDQALRRSRLLIGQPPPGGLLDDLRHALAVGALAGREAEIELGQVAGQVLLADVMVRPVQRAL